MKPRYTNPELRCPAPASLVANFLNSIPAIFVVSLVANSPFESSRISQLVASVLSVRIPTLADASPKFVFGNVLPGITKQASVVFALPHTGKYPIVGNCLVASSGSTPLGK